MESRNGNTVFSRLLRNRTTAVALSFIVFISLAGFFGPLVFQRTAGGLDEAQILAEPTCNHWMGTDMLGRDLLTMVFIVARVSLTVGVGTALIALVLCTTYGLIAGYKGGAVDSFLMRVVDVFYGLPDLLIFILLSLVLGRNVGGMLVALGLITWVRFARIAR